MRLSTCLGTSSDLAVICIDRTSMVINGVASAFIEVEINTRSVAATMEKRTLWSRSDIILDWHTRST